MLLSASNLHRFSLCPSSLLLPRMPYSQNQSAQRGTNIHNFIATAIDHGEEHARATLPARHNGRAIIDRINFPEVIADLVDLVSEIAIYWNVVTGECKVLGKDIGRNYYQAGAEDWSYVGSIDIVARNAVTGDLVIADVKTGLQDVQAAGCDQLQLLAYICSKIYEVSKVETRIIKIWDNGAIRINSHVIEEAEMKLIEQKLLGVHTKVMENVAAFGKGEATDYFYSDDLCKWCPCRTECPMYRQEKGMD